MPFTKIAQTAANTITDPTANFIEAANGAAGITEKNYTIGSAGGDLKVSYNMDAVPDKMDIYVNDQLMTSTKMQF